MSIGGFRAIVRITNTICRGGFDNSGIPSEDAEMELEGKLFEVNLGDFKKKITDNKKTEAFIKIAFTKKQEVFLECEEEEKNYIGEIQLTDNKNDEDNQADLTAIVSIVLPISMFNRLALMEGKNITFDTVHDAIKKPTKAQKGDHIVAFVKRVWFDKTSELPEQPKNKIWPFN